MKKLNIILAIFGLFALVSCSGDGGSGGSGTSESTAIKGTSVTVGTSINGVFTGGSAFTYVSGPQRRFLLCEGEANSWKDAEKKPHLYVSINSAMIMDNILGVTDLSKAIDVNDPSFANVECPVSVRWVPGNGMRFFNKYSYTGAVNTYAFDTGSLIVAKGPMGGMYMITFVGSGQDKDKNKWDSDWSYGGQFTHK